MLVDITDILGSNGAFIEFSEDIPVEQFVDGISDVKLKDKVHVNLKIKYLDETISVKGEVSGIYLSQCGRCLKDTKDEFKIDLDERFVKQTDEEIETDDYFYSGDKIDLTVPLLDNILLSLPSVILCKEDCAGLCQVCGTDLNVKICSCEKHDINIRMEKLKDYFNK